MNESPEKRIAALLARHPMPVLADLARGAQGRVALVGGALRDALLGRPVDDLDLVVDGDLGSFVTTVSDALGRRPASIGDRFQDTHRFRLGGVQVDIARSLGDLERDLARRDFTINAMAVELPADSEHPRLHDLHGGLDDLAAGSLRETAPGVLAADPLRLLRGVRYATVLEGFELDPDTRARMETLVPMLDEVAAERVRYEWQRVLEASRWVEGVALATDLGITARTFGAAPGDTARILWAAVEQEPDEVVRLAALLHDLSADCGLGAVEERLQRLRWPRRPGRAALRVARWLHELPAAAPEQLADRAIEDAPAARRTALLASALAGDGRPGGDAAARLFELAEAASEPRWVEGADLREWGMPAGEALGSLLRESWRGQLLGRWGGREDCRAWARQRVSAGSAPA